MTTIPWTRRKCQ